MSIEIGFTDKFTNTQYAPLAVLSAYYQTNQLLEPLNQVPIPMKTRFFSPGDKLIQVLLSILAGCGPLYEVNERLKPETGLATVWGFEAFSDQSNLSRSLDALSLKQMAPLREKTDLIGRNLSRAQNHDWRSFLWLDFDLSGLPCSKRAEASQKGYFSGKKTRLDVN
ncbi:MAG: hypothetical protein GY805_33915 [Chloroflexi bacterium]|nr:hypothetical protein [Chloroflexota bacterium]